MSARLRLTAASLVLAVFAVVAVLLPGRAAADHTWGQWHWPGSPKALVMVSDRSGLGLDIDRAVATWNRSAAVHLVNVGPVCPNRYAPHYCLTIYADRSMSQWNGYAQPHVFGGHILAADIRLGTRGSAPREVREAILLHEIGHGLGLNHRPQSSGSVMAPTVYAGWGPDAHDFTQLTANRPH